MTAALEPSRSRILVVDDSAVDRRLLSAILTRADFQVTTAADGEQGLSSAQSQPPDLILLDMVMTGMDGVAVCARLSQEPSTRNIPVIFVSAMDRASERVRGLRAGAVDYLVKPLHGDEVIARLGVHLQLKRARDELLESRGMLRAVLDAIPVRVFWKGLDSKYLGCNQSFANDAGLQLPEQVAGLDEDALGWGEHGARRCSEDSALTHGGVAKFEFEEQRTRADGTVFTAKVIKVPLRSTAGEPSGVLCTYEDVTARRRAETAARETTGFLGTLAAHVPGILAYLDGNRTFQFMNQRYAESFGTTVAAAIGKSYGEVVGAEHEHLTGESLDAVFAGASLSQEVFIHHPLIGQRWMLMSYAPHPDPAGAVNGAFLFGLDITERKQLENELRRSSLELAHVDPRE